MKNNLKISLIALSTLLTACGGGSGSGNSVPNTTLPTVSKKVEESNRQITSLKSRIYLTKEKPSSVRSATSSRAKQYADISDIEFTAFDKDEYAKLKFNVDENGQIISFKEIDGDKTYNRNDKNVFVYDGPVGEHMMSDEATFESMGKELKLSYFDFFRVNGKSIEYGPNGNEFISKEDSEDIDEYQMAIFGGYKEREIEPSKIENDITFTGKAVGGVKFKDDNNGNNLHENLALDGKATLTFNKIDTSSNLNMKFDNWYDVNITTSGEHTKEDTKVVFDNFTGNNDNFKFTNENKELKDDKFSQFSLSYYYDDETNKAVEAGGGINITEAMKNGEICNNPDDFDNSNGTNKYVDFNVAFGLKRD